MMETLLDVVVLGFAGLCIIGLFLCSWGLLRNGVTHRDRMKILNAMTEVSGEEFWRLAADYNKVSYDKHSRARLFLRDPWLLYPNSIRRLVGRPEDIPTERDQHDAVVL